MNKKLLSLYSLKFNPFSPEIPTSALWVAAPLENFCWRIEQQVGEGGFALAIGEPGTGKSVALRLLCARLGQLHPLPSAHRGLNAPAVARRADTRAQVCRQSQAHEQPAAPNPL